MAGGRYFQILVLLCFQTLTSGHEDIRAFINQINLLEQEVNQMKVEVPRFETRLINKMGLIELSLKGDLGERILPSYIQSLVEQSLSRMLRQQSVEVMVNSAVNYEVRHFKQGYEQMNRHVRILSRRMNNLEDVRNNQSRVVRLLEEQNRNWELKTRLLETELNNALLDVTRIELSVATLQATMSGADGSPDNGQSSNRNSWDLYDYIRRETNSIREDLTKLNNTHWKDMETMRKSVQNVNTHVPDGLENDIDRTDEKMENETATILAYNTSNPPEIVSESDPMNETVKPTNTPETLTDILSTSQAETNPTIILKTSNTSSPSQTETTEETTGFMPTSAYESVVEKMKRLLLVPRWSDDALGSYQMTLPDEHTLNYERSSYDFLSLSSVRSATYDPTTRRILFSRSEPAGVYASMLDIYGAETLQDNVVSHGMTVDEPRGLIFLSTNHPRFTVSQMTTRGDDYQTVVNLYAYRTNRLRGIAVDVLRRMIYVCNGDRILSVDYDGKHLLTMERKYSDDVFGINAVVYDSESNRLFFNIGTKVMMKSLSTGINTELTEVNHIWKFVYYNNNLYITTYREGVIGVVDLENNIYSTLTLMQHGNYDIVLLP